MFRIITSLLTLFFFLSFASSLHAGEVKNYVLWWPVVASNWVYKYQYGGVSFMKYDRATDYAKLQNDVNQLILTHKPHLISILTEWRDFQPLKRSYTSGSLPEGNATLADVVDPNFKFDYYDDLIKIIQEHDIEVEIYLNVSASGGQVAYPYTYYSKVGWFWKRPDWTHGIASPHSDAMRHPPNSGSDYNWIEHETGYYNLSPLGTRHWSQTTNNTEDTGLGIWPVAESPDMVFNGYDLVLHNNQLNIHVPIPSFSSSAWRNLTKEYAQKIATHFKGKNIHSYSMYQEPSYAHLRENMAYESHFVGNTGAGDAWWYDVDYSPAELNAYNQWRSSRGESAVTQVPYPVNANYDLFRKFNLAGFLNNLITGLKQGDPNAKTNVSVFEDSSIRSLATSRDILLQVTKPQMITFEPPHTNTAVFENATSRNQFIQTIRTNSNATQFFSYYNTTTNPQARDTDVANSFFANGFTTYYAPAFNSDHSVGSYAIWGPTCGTNCLFRYKSPGKLPVTIAGKVSCTNTTQGVASFTVGVVDNAGQWWSTKTDATGNYSLRFSTRMNAYAIRGGTAVPSGSGTATFTGAVCHENCPFDAVDNTTVQNANFSTTSCPNSPTFTPIPPTSTPAPNPLDIHPTSPDGDLDYHDYLTWVQKIKQKVSTIMNLNTFIEALH